MSSRRRVGLGLGWAALGSMTFLGWQPLPDALLRQLEARYPPAALTAADMRGYAGMVVLDGAQEPAWVSAGNGQVALNDAAERMTVPVELLRQEPHLILLFTGGAADAAQARTFFISLGAPEKSMIFEQASRTTFENATLSALVPSIDKSRPWLLVTSAWHMPRALATFRAVGWNVTPYPVDYRSGNHTPWIEYSMVKSLGRWQLALHEYVGWWAYWATGRLKFQLP